jgi:hypothetical protein
MRMHGQVDDHRRITLLLKEAGMYLQFLGEDVNSGATIRENLASQIEKLLKEATNRLRESANLLNLEVKGERKK